jgi:uncharacterized protein YndB with AHSA1/START domain
MTMTKETTSFVYVTYILSTPEKVFEAITKPDIARRYWGHENVSDWNPGSKWEHIRANDERTVELVGQVIEVHLGECVAGLRSGKPQPSDVRDRRIRRHGPADRHS